MLRDDHVLRQIRQVVEALARAVLQRKDKDAAAAEQTVDDVIEDVLGLSLDVVRAVTPATLLQLLSPAGALDRTRALTIGLALAEKASFSDHGEAWRQRAAALLSAAEIDDVERLLAEESARAELLASLGKPDEP